MKALNEKKIKEEHLKFYNMSNEELKSTLAQFLQLEK